MAVATRRRACVPCLNVPTAPQPGRAGCARGCEHVQPHPISTAADKPQTICPNYLGIYFSVVWGVRVAGGAPEVEGAVRNGGETGAVAVVATVVHDAWCVRTLRTRRHEEQQAAPAIRLGAPGHSGAMRVQWWRRWRWWRRWWRWAVMRMCVCARVLDGGARMLASAATDGVSSPLLHYCVPLALRSKTQGGGSNKKSCARGGEGGGAGRV